MLLGHPDYTSGSKSKPPYIKSIVGAMEEDRFVTDTLSAGESKFMVRCLQWNPSIAATIGRVSSDFSNG